MRLWFRGYENDCDCAGGKVGRGSECNANGSGMSYRKYVKLFFFVVCWAGKKYVFQNTYTQNTYLYNIRYTCIIVPFWFVILTVRIRSVFDPDGQTVCFFVFVYFLYCTPYCYPIVIYNTPIPLTNQQNVRYLIKKRIAMCVAKVFSLTDKLCLPWTTLLRLFIKPKRI